jgi:hypothetical protein
MDNLLYFGLVLVISAIASTILGIYINKSMGGGKFKWYNADEVPKNLIWAVMACKVFQVLMLISIVVGMVYRIGGVK